MIKLKELCKRLELKFSGAGNLELKFACGLGNLKENGVAFIDEDKGLPADIYFKKRNIENKNKLNKKKIAIVVPNDFKGENDYNLIFSKDPLLTHTKICALLHPLKLPKLEIDKSAVIGKNVKLGKNVRIGAGVVLYDNVNIGNKSVIFSGTIIMENVTIGNDCILYPNVVIRDNCHIGNRVVLHPNSVIGADGHGYFQRNGKNYKIPQIGKVYIEDDVEIGACSCVDRGRFENTFVRKGTKIDNQVQIAHNVDLGENSLLSGQSAIGGSTKIGKNFILGGQSGVRDNIKIGNRVIVAGQSGVASNTKDGAILSGSPAIPIEKWRRNTVFLNNIEKIVTKLKNLEKKLK